MNNLTKAQVLALFLGTTNATLTALEVINGPFTVFNALTAEQKKTAADRFKSSGTACANNAACTTANEVCGAIQEAGAKAADVKGICVHKNNCGALGILNGKDFSVQCWATPKAGGTAVAPALVDPDALLTALQGLITKDSVDWKLQNLYVSSEFNYQDGWWTVDAKKVWTEVDKPPNNSCFGNGQCQPVGGAAQCCATYPDSNNRKCMLKSKDKTKVTVGPVTFVPACAVDSGTGTVTDSKSDIAKTALANASEKITKFQGSQDADAKKKAGYDKMTATAQKDYDAKVAAEAKKRTTFYAELKKAAGADASTCDDACKLKYENDLYDFIEEKYKLCKADAKQLACVKADDLMKNEVTARGKATKNYYSKMDDAERTAFKKNRAADIKKEEATLTALVKKEKAPKAGAAGSACTGTKCTDTTLCCGTATPTANAAGVTTGQEVNICGSATAGYSDVFGKKYTHVCNSMATKLAVTGAAIAAAFTLM